MDGGEGNLILLTKSREHRACAASGLHAVIHVHECMNSELKSSASVAPKHKFVKWGLTFSAARDTNNRHSFNQRLPVT